MSEYSAPLLTRSALLYQARNQWPTARGYVRMLSVRQVGNGYQTWYDS
jgi:hypothetical protein